MIVLSDNMQWGCGTKSSRIATISYLTGCTNRLNDLSCYYIKMAYQSGLQSMKRKNLQTAWPRLHWNTDYKYQGGKFEMEYRILVGNSAALLEERVNDVVNFGWKPIGGASLTFDNYQNKFWIQTMVKGD